MNDLYIKTIRDKLDISQEKLAEMIGVSIRTVQNWEAGKKIPASKHAILRSMISDDEVANTQSSDKQTKKKLLDDTETTRLDKLISQGEINVEIHNRNSRSLERLITIIENQQETINNLTKK
ncbi:MAG: helix-turn-helix domain-containing protein [Paludibacteraceae bacterium]|nr:helix-turn-helix domain-containing protein [Paludibacteraceae bacterium]